MNTQDTGTASPLRAAILLVKASITGAAEREMQELAERTQAALAGRFARVVHAFSEQGSPSLREALNALAAGDAATGRMPDDITIVPLLLPMEPGYRTWITSAVQRWRREIDAMPCGPDAASLAGPRRMPEVNLCAPVGDHLAIDALVQGLLAQPATVPIHAPTSSSPAGSVIPPQKHRVLVCQGGPCNQAGAALVWCHLRNAQKRLDLRNAAPGMMSARTSCLGPCNLAPVVQVFPDGTWYGGVNEAGIDRIIESHLQRGEVVADLAYPPLPGKQTLR